MNPAVTLLLLHQGNCPLEEYVWDYDELCDVVDINDIALKGIFRNGLSDFLNYLMPQSDIPGTLADYIVFALLLSGSSFTVGIADKEPCNLTALTTPEPRHVMAVTPEPHHIMATTPEPSHVMAAMPETCHVMAATPESCHVMAGTPKPSHVMAATPESRHVLAATPEPCHVMSAMPESHNVMVAQVSPGGGGCYRVTTYLFGHWIEFMGR